MRKAILVFLFCLIGGGCILPAPPASTRPVLTPTLAAPTPASSPALVVIPSPAPSSTPAVCLVHTDNPGGHVNIRGGPGMRFPVLAVAAEGDILTLTGRTDPAGWSEVRNQAGLIGWFYIPTWCKGREK